MARARCVVVGKTLCFVGVLLVCGQCGKGSEDAEPLTGIWQGSVATLGYSFGLAVHVDVEDGKSTVQLDAIDSRVRGFTAKEVVVAGRSVAFTMGTTTFAGDVGDDGKLRGVWREGLRKIDVCLEPTDSVAWPRRTQELQPPLPYDELDVAYHYLPDGLQTLQPTASTAANAISLAGRLTVPHRDGPHPAVVLVSGSGPDRRDATVMGHHLFRVLGDHLTRQGFAVLTYDERGIGKSTGDFAAATLTDLADDVRAGVRFLRGREDIDGDRIALIGHSEGGMVAPIVAGGPDAAMIKCIVSLAGPAVGAETLLSSQFRALRELRGMKPADIDVLDGLFREQCAILRAEADSERCHAKVEAAVHAAWPKLSADGKAHLHDHVGNLMASTLRMNTPKSRAWLEHDPAAGLAKLQCPTLVLTGSKDMQVLARLNLPAARAALKDNENATCRELPDLNHLFQTCKTGTYEEYATIEETMSPKALTTITDWLQDHL